MKTIFKKLFLIILILNSVNFSYAQDAEKTVTLVVSGSGKTQDEANQKALRSAIEQAFGTFISSETVINNDVFISENITTLSQGSVIDFKVLASTIFPDSTAQVTLKATVSISQMNKITESKGYKTTINGGLFGLNLKLLKLQSEAETKVVLDMVRKCIKILEKSIDYEMEVIPPKKSDLRKEIEDLRHKGYTFESNKLAYNEIYKIRAIVEIRPNSNLDIFIDYFLSTLTAIKMSETEIDFAKQSGSNYYHLFLNIPENDITFEPNKTTFYLRNIESIKIINRLFEVSNLNLFNYDIISDNKIINYTPLFKKDSIQMQNYNYNYKKLQKLGEYEIQINDSNHYIFIYNYNLFGDRIMSANNLKLNNDYPSSIDIISDQEYSMSLYKTYSSYPWSPGSSIQYNIIPGDKYRSAGGNMNVRFQVLDFYLPLSDVERLNTMKIIKHESTSIAK